MALISRVLTRLRAEKGSLSMAFLYVSSTGSLMLGSVAQLATFILLARYLGSHQFGVLMAINAATAVGVQLCGLGANEGMVRRVSRDRADYAALLGHNLVLVLGSGVVLVPVIAGALALYLSGVDDAQVSWGAVLLFTVSNVVLFRCILLAEEIFISHWRIAQANLVNIGFAIAKMATAALACLVFGLQSLETWAWWHAATHLAFALVCAAAVRPYGAPDWRFLQAEFWLGLNFSATRFFFSLRENIDVLVLGLVVSPAIVGNFAVAKRILDTSLITSRSLNRLIYPNLSVAGRQGPRGTLALTLRLLKYTLAIAASTALALYLAAPLLPLLFGGDFSRTVPLLQVLCWAAIPIALQAAAYEALGGAEKHAIRTLVYAIGSIIGAAVIAILTYMFLLPGTLLAIFLVEGLLGVLLWITLLRLARHP